MLELEQYVQQMNDIEKNIEEMRVSLDVETSSRRIAELEREMAEPDFWNHSEKAAAVIARLKAYKSKVDKYKAIADEFEDLKLMLELLQEEEDTSLAAEIPDKYEKLVGHLEVLRIETLLDDKYDANNAILSLHSGAGGLEAQDWTEMLMRMYTRWAESRGYGVKVLDLLADDEGGIKSATLLVEGENAYGYLKAEKGVHRLVRISPFDSSGRRHTSFASLDVMPELDDDVEVNINPDDLRIDTYRASGAGGQHVNKTDSAIRITHIPTGIVVQCQNERSQHSNRETAMRMLKSKLVELKEREQKERIEDLQGEYNQIAWGSQIRSYVFHPYSMVKDHRTNVEVGNVNRVMDGDLDEFI
ncbi:MAG: peptide chain release factor 2, partial [Clostridiales bacterium]|nr:peptide chain release factor 2 [Clostridiales bacterium]